MTPADWRALAERFEAATEDDIYECVRALVGAAVRPLNPAGRLVGDLPTILSVAVTANTPDLLLGVVVACVPEGWAYRLASRPCVPGGRATLVKPGTAVPMLLHEGDEIVGGTRTGPAAAALGDAVCRAWAEVAGGKEVA